MMPMIPDVLKQNKDQWTFSEEEPWKPVAKENASEETRNAISEFIAEIQDNR